MYSTDSPEVDASNANLKPATKSAVYGFPAAFVNIQLLTESYSRKNVRLWDGSALVQRSANERTEELIRTVANPMTTSLDRRLGTSSLKQVMEAVGGLCDSSLSIPSPLFLIEIRVA